MRRFTAKQVNVLRGTPSTSQRLLTTVHSTHLHFAGAAFSPRPLILAATMMFPLRWAHATITPRRFYFSTPAEHHDDEEEYVLDAHAQVLRDAKIHAQTSAIEELIDDLIPEDVAPTAEARQVIRKRLQANPINKSIVADRIVITHVLDVETGKEAKMKLPPQPLEEALKLAEERKLDLVQMAEKDSPNKEERGVRYAYCRIRNERAEIDKLLEAHVAAQGESEESDSNPNKMRESISHVFRDVVNAHFVDWRSKRIVQDLKKHHPVRLSIQKFVEARAAVSKMQEMMDAIKKNAEENEGWHHFTGVNISDKELSVTLAPSLSSKRAAAKTVKHPSRKDWGNVLERFQALCQESGRSGTYQKKNFLRKRNVGVRQFRVDKFGRKLD